MVLKFTHEEPKTQGRKVHLRKGKKKKGCVHAKGKKRTLRDLEWLQCQVKECQVKECVYVCVGGGGDKGGRVESR